MVDDLGAIDERVLKRLPSIEALFLNRGLRFKSAYAETPLCCPGRASFLTGQHTKRHGVVTNDARLLNPRQTIATALDDAGYFTMLVGKYLNGAEWLSSHTPPGWDQVAMLADWTTNVSSEWWINGSSRTAGHKDRFVAQQSVEWLERAPSDKPLFMWVTPHAPHNSAAAPEVWKPDIEPRYVGDPRCSGITPWRPPSYQLEESPNGFPLDDICRSLLTVDDTVGDLRAEMQRQGRDPYWIFMSDNGMAWGAGGQPLKNVPQAGRLPFYVSGPGVVKGSTGALISNIDIGPTLAAIAGVEMPAADGKSFERVLRGGRGTRSLMLEDHPLGGYTPDGQTGPWWGVRTRHWHLVVWRGVHLFDTDADPWERHDLARERPEVVERLASEVNRVGQLDRGPTPRPTPSERPTALPPTPAPTPTDAPTPTAMPTATDAPAPTPMPTQSSPTALPSATTRPPSPTPTANSASPGPPTATSLETPDATSSQDSDGTSVLPTEVTKDPDDGGGVIGQGVRAGPVSLIALVVGALFATGFAFRRLTPRQRNQRAG